MKVRWQTFINGIDIIIQLRQVPAQGSFKPIAATQYKLSKYELISHPDRAAMIKQIKHDMTRELMRYVKAV